MVIVLVAETKYKGSERVPPTPTPNQLKNADRLIRPLSSTNFTPNPGNTFPIIHIKLGVYHPTKRRLQLLVLQKTTPLL
jgi:hypothetical protein